MNYLFQIYKTQILTTALVIALFSWALVASSLALGKSSKKTLVIERRCDSAFTISNPDLDEEHRYIQSFIYQFISTLFHFNNNTYKENMKKAGSLMRLRLWDLKKDEILKISKEIKNTHFHQTFEIENLEKIKSSLFRVTLKTFYHKNDSILEDKIKMELFIQKTKLREDNPWGMEVRNYSIESS